MKTYKRLSEKDLQKIKKNKLLRRKMKNILKCMSIFVAVFSVLCVGIVSFYKIIDGFHVPDENDEAQITSNTVPNQKYDSDEERVEEEDSSPDDTPQENKNDEQSNEQSNKQNEKQNYDTDNIEGEHKSKNDTPKKQNDESTKNKSQKSTASIDFSEWNKTCKRELLVVNKFSKAYDGATINTKLCRGKEVGIELVENLEKMILDARNDGIILWILSGYRSISRQTKLFNEQILREKKKGLSEQQAIEASESVVARPGTSEHNIGLAIDFNSVENNFCNTKEYKWLTENAHKYGFIERYKKEWQNITGVISEPWHFRYVGQDNAPKIKESGMCLEEYVSKKLMGKTGTGGIF